MTLAMDHPRLADAAEYLLGDVLGLSAQAPPIGQPDCGNDGAHG